MFVCRLILKLVVLLYAINEYGGPVIGTLHRTDEFKELVVDILSVLNVE
jgi:hypothetical protein